MHALTLDSGALIAFERNERQVVALISEAVRRRLGLAVPAGVVAQVWRDGRKQARLARLLGAASVEIVPLDDHSARSAGQLCGICGTGDVIDASVVVCARTRGRRIATSEESDLHRLDPAAILIAV